jgi:DNA-directed RNA polymerase beta subunit
MSIVSPQIETFEPFSSNTDASRTNMSSKQLLQCIITDTTETPYILNKNYKVMTMVNSPYVKIAAEDGAIIYNNNNLLGIYYFESKRIHFDYIPETKKMVNNSLTLKYVINKIKFNKGDILFDYTNQDPVTNIPKIGFRTNVMYSSFFGFNADDAIVISESFAERARIDYTEKIFIPITPELKFLKNPNTKKYLTTVGEITEENYYLQYQRVDNSKHFLSELINISETPSKFQGRRIETIMGGEILSFKVHKLSKKSFDELKTDYIYTPTLIDEIETQYKNQYEIYKHIEETLKKSIPNEATVIAKKLMQNYFSVESFTDAFMTDLADNYKIESKLIDIVLEIEIYKNMPTCVGDKFANLFAGKGVVSMILPDELMPKDESGDPADIIFNPLGLFGRNNWGTIFEIALGKIIEDIEENINNKTQTLRRLKFINKKFIKLYDNEYHDQVNAIINDFDNLYDSFKEDVETRGFYLFVSNFPGISYYSFIQEFVLEYEKTFEINITGKEKTVFKKELIQYLRDQGFKTNIFSDSEDIEQMVQFGKNYYMKLFHTSWSKYNSVGFSSSYSRNTGQPARGRKNKGGGHVSWQTLASLLGYKANNAVLKEFYTIKSDVAISDKKIFLSTFVSEGMYFLKNKYFSQTKQALNNALKMIGMKFK